MPQEIKPKAAKNMVTTLNPASIADRSETTRRGLICAKLLNWIWRMCRQRRLNNKWSEIA
ncbi:hypothetical protein HanXRQr2_Chr17g0810601 [Helianthus annuus]|uniref:Uncharacterized protein n=1 Tax=Helianthus annuus TaxID=4232 RepID=A0A9K3DIG2_HELAN|nr:hypothetical protein HanXRQr2_Chr17g0810601 [Helianthus annuus]